MTHEEWQKWRAEQHKKTKLPKKKVSKSYFGRGAAQSRKVAKYGIYKIKGVYSGSFGSRNS